MTRSQSWAVLVGIIALLQAAAPAAERPASSSAMISILTTSRLPLTKGAEDCSSFAKEYGTLGSLVRHFRKVSDRLQVAECRPEFVSEHALPCKLRMSNAVPPERSEEEFELMIYFELRGRNVGAFKCFFAG